MSRVTQAGLLGALTLAANLFMPVALAGQDLDRGRELYEKWCAGCHGNDGTGNGAAAEFMLPRPRNFSRAVFQIRTTANGELPTDDDLRRIIDVGMPGTTMPGWENKFSSRERDDVIAYVKSFSRFFDGPAPEPIAVSAPPRVTPEGIAEGRRVFLEDLECYKCHGDQGRGDGPSAAEQTDDWDFPILPRDLTENWFFNGGGSVEDIHMRLLTGLDGTSMPSFTDAIDAGVITDEQLWRVAQYVASLSPEGPPRVRDVVRAALATGSLPGGPEAPEWEVVERYYIPMVGQIILAPRAFSPTVDGLWVQAMHDGTNLSILISWDDPSESPDPRWQEYHDLVALAMTDVDGPMSADQGPDRLMVQFPLRQETGTDLPFFLGGDARRAAYSLRWASDPDRLEQGTSRGLDAFIPVTGEVTHAAIFSDGQWRLQLNRALMPADTTAAAVFPLGVPLPIAFFAADGSNGEDSMRGSVSAWYAIYLDVPTPPSTFVIPVVAVMLTAGLGLVAVWRAKAEEQGKTE